MNCTGDCFHWLLAVLSRISNVKGTLLFAILDFDDRSATSGTDSAQWWITEDRSFSITTYSDLTFSVIDVREKAEKILPFAQRALESYTNGNPVKRGEIHFENIADLAEVKDKCEANGLEPTIFVEDNLIVFWRNGELPYRLDLGETAAEPKSGGFLKRLFGKK